MARAFGMFLKRPVPGQVKTRLAAEVGEQTAADLYAAFVADLADRFRTAGDRRFLAYSPDDEPTRGYVRSLAGSDYELWAQPAVDLGQRMQAFFEHAGATRGQPTVLIGSDTPSLPHDYVEQAFDHLQTHDCVLGPATDGGYYLIGLRQAVNGVFDGIDWSSARVLDQTIERLACCDATLALLPPWYDVDTADDLMSLRGHLAAARLAGTHLGLCRTESLLRELG